MPGDIRFNPVARSTNTFELSISALGADDRWRPEEHGVIDDETEFRLGIAHVALLPDRRILCFHSQPLQRTVARPILDPQVEFIPVSDRRRRHRIYRIPAMRVPGANAE